MYPSRQAFRAAVLSMVVSVILSACGGDAGTGTITHTEGAPTDSEFIDQVNGLCAQEAAAIGQTIGPLFGGDEPSPEDMQAALDEVVALSRGLADDIDALAIPPALAEDVDALVAALNDGTDQAAAQTGVEFFGSDDDPWSTASAMAADLGLSACGPGNDE